MTARLSIVTIYVRHQPPCRYVNRKGRSFARDCECVKWLRYSGEICTCPHNRKGPHKPHRQHKQSTGSRSWSVAEDKRADLQRRLDSGETNIKPIVEVKRQTIEQNITTFINGKEGEGVQAATIRKLRFQLGAFKQFLAERSKFFPDEIQKEDVIDYRKGWAETWISGRTRQKAQQNLRGFIRFACRDNRDELLENLKAIKLSKADKARSKPQPFSEEQLSALYAQIPKSFPEEKAARMTALIHFMVGTGTAIRDTIQLERAHIANGKLKFERQKTEKPVEQTLDDGLYKELKAVANGNPKYIFWNGTSEATSAVGLWQEDLRTLMKAADLWTPGNLSHRFRDTAVDWWIGNGYSLTEIAAMLGDTTAIVEEHYKDWASKRMQERLAKLPRRSFEVANV